MLHCQGAHGIKQMILAMIQFFYEQNGRPWPECHKGRHQNTYLHRLFFLITSPLRSLDSSSDF